MNNDKIITIDGPSASGKGTIAKKLASILEYNYLDSGAIYRIIAYIQHVNPKFNLKQILQHFHSLKVEFLSDNILLNGIDISSIIRSENIGNLASKIASEDTVRTSLLEWQRKYATSKGLVTDGRDMGTIVFPQAKYKFFLIAQVKERAKRRYQQLLNLNIANLDFNQVLQNLHERDERDINRKHAPLNPAKDAFILDSTHLSIDDTIQVILQHLQNQLQST
jgi:cytidylate kinase